MTIVRMVEPNLDFRPLMIEENADNIEEWEPDEEWNDNDDLDHDEDFPVKEDEVIPEDEPNDDEVTPEELPNPEPEISQKRGM